MREEEQIVRITVLNSPVAIPPRLHLLMITSLPLPPLIVISFSTPLSCTVSFYPTLLIPPSSSPPHPLVSPLILYPMSHLPSPSQLPPWLSLTFLHPFVLLSHLTVCPCTSYNTILLHINQNSNYMTCKIGMVLCNHVCQLAEQEW